MKKLLPILLIISLVLNFTACGGNDATSSLPSVASDTVSKLYKNDFGEQSSSTTESKESKVTGTTASTSSTKTESETESTKSESSKKTSSKNKTSSKKPSNKGPYASADVKPSDRYNPTGLYSVDRTNNSGDNWRMTLVNPWNTLSFKYSISLGNVDSRFGTDKQFDARAVGDLNAMCEAALEDGVYLTVISAFRTYDYQNMLFQNEVAEYKSYHPGCSEEEAEKGAATEVARPGTSEHNLGLAVDFNSVEQSFENTKAFKWLQKNCTDYGFILRYSASKLDITGVIYEPWHYRYVGRDNAKKIAASGLTLEEYIQKN